MPLAYFGLVNQRVDPPDPAWPTVRFGAWRLWDSMTAWNLLEPQRGRWQFKHLDRMVDEAERHQVKLLLVLAHSPTWASSEPELSVGYGPGATAPPRDMADWDNYVRTIATRYRGRIQEFQIWNEPSDRNHYSGDLATMVEMTCRAWRILKEVSPDNVVVSPALAGGGAEMRYLERFLAAGGRDCIDVVAHHLYVFRLGPEAFVPLLRELRAVMRRQGVQSKPIWITEVGWWIARTDGLPEMASVARGGWRRLDPGDEAGAFIQRSFLLARAEGVERLYWYSWRNWAWGLVNARDEPKPAVQHWNAVVDQMLGQVVGPCRAQGDIWRCEMRTPGSSAPSVWRWQDPTALQAREGPLDRPFNPAMLPRREGAP